MIPRVEENMEAFDVCSVSVCMGVLACTTSCPSGILKLH